MDWIQWLFDYSNFTAPVRQPGWTPALVSGNLLAFVSQTVVSFALAMLCLLMAQFRSDRIPSRAVAYAFAVLFFLDSVAYACRIVSFQYPIYRLVVVANVLAALQAVVAFVTTVPFVLRRDWVRKGGETQVAADKLEAAAQDADTQLRRLERIQSRLLWREEELNRILAALDGLPRILPDPPRPEDADDAR